MWVDAMSDLTPSQLEAKLRTTIHRLEELSETYRDEAIIEARTEADYRIAYAGYFLTAPFERVADKEPHAMHMCGEDGTMLARKIAAAIADGTKQALYSERAVLSALQTMARAIQDEMRTAGFGTP